MNSYVSNILCGQRSIKANIMAIDRDLATLRLLKMFFENAGVSIATRSSLREGLEEIIEKQPSLILCELCLALKEGENILKNILTSHNLQHIQIFYLTLDNLEEIPEKIPSVQRNHIILKPFKFEQLRDLLLDLVPDREV